MTKNVEGTVAPAVRPLYLAEIRVEIVEMAVEIQALLFKAEIYSKADSAVWCRDHDFLDSDYSLYERNGDPVEHVFLQFDGKLDNIDQDSWAFIGDTFPNGIRARTCVRNKSMKYKSVEVTKAGEVCMTDNSIDRVGDIVVPSGGDLDQFKSNPIMLLGHDHTKIIGVWTNIRKTVKGIFATPHFAEEGTSDYADTARKLYAQGILKAASIGFQPIDAKPIKETGGYKFTKWILHECSLVAVPANPNALAVAKSIGADPEIVRSILAKAMPTGHSDAPGSEGTKKGTAARPVSRKQSQRPNKGRKVMDIAKRIAAKEERLVAIKDDLTELKALVENDETLTDEQLETIDVLTDEEESVIKSIESLRKLENGLAKKAQPASALARRGVAPGAPAKQKKGGSLFAKHVTAQLFAKEFQQPLASVVEALYGNDDEVKATLPFTMEKTAVAAADTTTAGWAKELVQEDTDAFMSELQPISVYAALRARGRAMNFNGMGSLKIPFRSAADAAANSMAGSWVGEGGVIPVKKGALTSKTLNPYKLAVISAWTNELDARAVPAIEAMVRDMILDDTAKTLDGYLLDGVPQVNNVRPAGLMDGVTPVASSGAAGANVITDLKVLFTAMQTARVGANPVMILNSIRLLGLSTITTAAGGFLFRDEIAAGRLLGVPVIAAEHVPAANVYIVDAGSFVGANDTPRFAVSDQATLTMANADTTAPTQAEGAAGAVGTVADQVPQDGGIHVNEDVTQAFAAGAQAQSLFQTYSTAIRMVLPTGWGMTRPGGVAAINTVAW